MAATDTHRAIDAVWRIESPRLIAGLTRIVRDLSLAEDLAHDALVAALEQWPGSGVPRNPGAWLMAAAKHRAIDALRRKTMLQRKHEDSTIPAAPASRSCNATAGRLRAERQGSKAIVAKEHPRRTAPGKIDQGSCSPIVGAPVDPARGRSTTVRGD